MMRRSRHKAVPGGYPSAGLAAVAGAGTCPPLRGQRPQPTGSPFLIAASGGPRLHRATPLHSTWWP